VEGREKEGGEEREEQGEKEGVKKLKSQGKQRQSSSHL
jgi:hypothetical protein